MSKTVITTAPTKPARKPRALVLAPTRELAIQIGEEFRAYGKHLALRQTVIFGGVGQKPQVTALVRGLDILIATPGAAARSNGAAACPARCDRIPGPR